TKAGLPFPPKEPLYNLRVNEWSLFDPGSTYFLPINELTFLFINGEMEILDEYTNAFIVDERANFQPAGIGKVAKSKGGQLDDDPRNGRVITVQQVENLVIEFVTAEQGAMIQNLMLM